MTEDGNPNEGQSPASGKTRRKDRPVTDNPDVHLDAPQLKVDELNLNLLGILTADIKGLETELLLEADENGDTTRIILDEAGEVSAEEIVGNVSELLGGQG